jgi:aspartyl-tRNA(Asn)/glutamyl-tRNA(Gln) amidotransferase subunit A
VELPSIPDLPIEPIEAYTFHAEYLKEQRTRELYQPQTRDRLLSGRNIPASTYVEARRHIDRLRLEIRDTFSKVDLLITPTTPELPGTIEDARKPLQEPGPPFSIRNTRPFNVYGLPTISIPCGFSKTGLPIGLQISGPPLTEMNVLALARAYEERTDWHKRRPSLP